MHLHKTALAALLTFVSATAPVSATMATAKESAASKSASSAAALRLVDSVDLKYEKFQLDNGLTVLVYPDHSVPKVFIGVWYKVGAKDEPEGRSGFAHLFEHLMFEPTANRKTSYAEEMSTIGATGMNGTTGEDRTNYFQTVPTAALDRALWLQSDRMINLLGGITQDVLDKQRAVVKNEKRQSELQPGSEAYERLLHHVYPTGHPYAHTVIGSMEDLDAASLDDVKQWFSDYYGGLNTYVVLAGDIDVETAKAKAQKYFGALPPGKPLDRIEQWIPTRDSVQIDVNYDNVGSTNFMRVWGLPNNDSRDALLMGLVANTLAGSPNTPLQRRLVQELQLATRVGADVKPGEVNGTFSIMVELKPGASVEKVGAVIDEELKRYFEQGPSADIVANANLAYSAGLIRSLEDPARVGALLLENELFNGDPVRFLDEMRWMMNSTPKELASLSRKWLDKPYYESQLHPIARRGMPVPDVDRSTMPQLGSYDDAIEFPAISQATLPNGMKLVVAERHQFPVVDVSMVFHTGSLLDGKYAEGVASQAFGLMTRGTGKYSREQLEQARERIAATGLSGRADEDHSVFGFGALSQYLDQATALAAEILRNPIYPQSEIDKAIAEVDGQFDGYEANPLRGASSAAFGAAIWGADHRRGHIVTRDEAKKISRDLLEKFHDREIGPNNATVYMIGDITLEQGKALLQRHFGDWHKVEATPVGKMEPPAGQPGKVILINAPGTPQASIIVGNAIPAFDIKDAAVETLVNRVIGGSFSSRLNSNLREEKGWAYGFGSRLNRSPLGEGVFSAAGSVQIDKTAESMMEIRRELTGVVSDHPITKGELDRERQSAVRSYASSMDSSGAFMSSMIRSASYGVPLDHAAGGASRLQAVTQDQAEAYAKQLIHPDQLTWVVVGDLRLIEEPIRALNFGPVEVWDVYGNRIR